MPRICAAIGCTNGSFKNPCKDRYVSFHSFPLADKMLLRRWLINMRRANFQPTRFTPICSDHFTEGDFAYQPFTNRRTLKKGAVPTKFSYEPVRRKRKLDELEKNQEYESDEKEEIVSTYRQFEPAESKFIKMDVEQNELAEVDKAALLDISMNEKFYLPKQVEMLTNGLSKRKCDVQLKVINAMREKLAAKIVLRTLKKQMIEAEIKAAVTRRDYFETKKITLSKMHNIETLYEGSEDWNENSEIIKNIKVHLEEEELSAKIEERMLRQHLKEAETSAVNCEKELHKAKSLMQLDSNDSEELYIICPID